MNDIKITITKYILYSKEPIVTVKIYKKLESQDKNMKMKWNSKSQLYELLFFILRAPISGGTYNPWASNTPSFLRLFSVFVGYNYTFLFSMSYVFVLVNPFVCPQFELFFWSDLISFTISRTLLIYVD